MFMDIFVQILRGLLGLVFLVGVCYALSSNRKAINWRLVITGILIQVVIGFSVIKIPFVADVFSAVADIFTKVLGCSRAGAEFLFGNLVTNVNSFGFIFAFQVLPTIVFFSALSSALYYMGILQFVVKIFARTMMRFMKLSGAESLAAGANIFMGQTEAPLVIKPYIANMTRSELLCLMGGGMATIAGSVFGAFVLYLGGTDPVMQKYFATHLLTASIMSAPAAIVAAKIILPETEAISETTDIPKDQIGSNLLDAISRGTSDGLRLAVNVGAMLLTFTAIIYLLNKILMMFGHFYLPTWVAQDAKTGYAMTINNLISIKTANAYQGLNFQYIMGLLGAPVAWLLGTPDKDCLMVGQLIGEKTTINEFVAYAHLETLKTGMSAKAVIIATYALCGFSNFASIGIQIGGIGALAPNRQSDLASLGIRALIVGSVACFMTATIAGMMFGG